MTTYLKPIHSNAKSFYCKAQVEARDGRFLLLSFGTPICWVSRNGGQPEIHRLWEGWTATTGRHIVEFCKQNARPGEKPLVGNKADCDKLPVESPNRF